MVAKKRTDNKGRVLRTGEMQRAEDNRYLYRYTDLSGKKRTVYALTLTELREKETQIQQIHVRTFYADLVKKGFAANTIKYYHGLISPALELAVDSDIIRKNPAKDCKKGVGGTKQERSAMTIAEQEKMMEFQTLYLQIPREHLMQRMRSTLFWTIL